MPPPRSLCSWGKATLAISASAACIAVAIIRPRVAIRRPDGDGADAVSARAAPAASAGLRVSGTGPSARHTDKISHSSYLYPYQPRIADPPSGLGGRRWRL